MTLKEAYLEGCGKLAEAGIEEAKLDAWYLLEYVTNVSRAQYYLHMDAEISAEQEEDFKAKLSERAKHIPLQHIVGTQEFMGLIFRVSDKVLIPRQDTEVLVESVLDIVKPGMEVLDMCTGSGCILISLLKRKEGLHGWGVDISEEALLVAKENAQMHHVKATFLQSDLFEKVEGRYDVIVSNPPYIRTDVIKELKEEVKFHDPILALDGKEDGLHFYREIVKNIFKYLKKDGSLYFEIGHDQGEPVKRIMEEAGFTGVTVKKDLAGLDRVVFGVYS